VNENLRAELARPAAMDSSLAKARARADSIRCVNNMKNIGLAARIYAPEHQDTFPPEATIQTYFWALSAGNFERMLECLSPSARPRKLPRRGTGPCEVERSYRVLAYRRDFF